MIRTFMPNDVVTYETCPVCQEPNIKVEHGHVCVEDDTGHWQETEICQHYEHCPECGTSMPIVAYFCQYCEEVKV